MHGPGVWQSVLRSGLLQQALPEIQEAWRSISARLWAGQAAESGDLIAGSVGGGQMGHPLAHLNEAPFPVWLTEFFIRSFCPEGGRVLDVFAGSGTTLAVAKKWGRQATGVEIRPDQCDIIVERLRQEVLF